MWACLECGRKFRTTAAARRAATSGCPKCGGGDVDLDVSKPSKPTTVEVPGGKLVRDPIYGTWECWAGSEFLGVVPGSSERAGRQLVLEAAARQVGP